MRGLLNDERSMVENHTEASVEQRKRKRKARHNACEIDQLLETAEVDTTRDNLGETSINNILIDSVHFDSGKNTGSIQARRAKRKQKNKSTDMSPKGNDHTCANSTSLSSIVVADSERKKNSETPTCDNLTPLVEKDMCYTRTKKARRKGKINSSDLARSSEGCEYSDEIADGELVNRSNKEACEKSHLMLPAEEDRLSKGADADLVKKTDVSLGISSELNAPQGSKSEKRRSHKEKVKKRDLESNIVVADSERKKNSETPTYENLNPLVEKDTCYTRTKKARRKGKINSSDLARSSEGCEYSDEIADGDLVNKNNKEACQKSHLMLLAEEDSLSKGADADVVKKTDFSLGISCELNAAQGSKSEKRRSHKEKVKKRDLESRSSAETSIGDKLMPSVDKKSSPMTKSASANSNISDVLPEINSNPDTMKITGAVKLKERKKKRKEVSETNSNSDIERNTSADNHQKTRRKKKASDFTQGDIQNIKIVQDHPSAISSSLPETEEVQLVRKKNSDAHNIKNLMPLTGINDSCLTDGNLLTQNIISSEIDSKSSEVEKPSLMQNKMAKEINKSPSEKAERRTRNKKGKHVIPEERACGNALVEKSESCEVPLSVNKGQKLDSLLVLPQRALRSHARKKLLVLDLNGLLCDITRHFRGNHKADKIVGKNSVFKRPFYCDFLKFCFERFHLGVWSSRKKINVDGVVQCIFGNTKHKLLFCWDLSKCTVTGCNTIENRRKPLVLKEMKKLWNKEETGLPWEKGDYSPANTLLLDDSPYKALCNPPHTAIFPQPYHFSDKNDYSLGPGGDIRVYLEGVAMADDVQLYVQEHPFGQRAITADSASWKFYERIINTIKNP